MGTQQDVHIYDVMVIDNVAHKIYKLVVHEFSVHDSDPDVYAAVPLMEWQNSEKGQWVKSHSVQTPMWQRHLNYVAYDYRYVVIAWLKDVDYTFYQLKWGQSI